MKLCVGCGYPMPGESCPRCDIKGPPVVKRKGRGPGKKPALFCTSIRLSKEVMDYFEAHHPGNKQAKMREILAAYVNNNGANHD
jgi:uncharacterized protein (DUF4415 family)